jgi:hypothetical protein
VADEFISFDKVLRELQMQEEELKRLVSEGEIRAFRDQDKMKFKKEDVDRFRKTRPSAKDETMGAAEVPEELVFDEDDANQDVGMATAAISDDSFLEEEPPKAAPEAAPAPAPAKAAARGGRSPSASASGRKPRASSVQVGEAQSEGIGFKLAILVSSIVLVFGMFVAMDATRATPSGLTRGIADWFKSKN